MSTQDIRNSGTSFWEHQAAGPHQPIWLPLLNRSFHFLFMPPQGGLLEIPYPPEFYFKVFPSDIQILCDFRASNASEYYMQCYFVAEPPWICAFVDFESLWILTSFESQKEATPWIFPENGSIGTPWIYSSLEEGGMDKKWNGPTCVNK